MQFTAQSRGCIYLISVVANAAAPTETAVVTSITTGRLAGRDCQVGRAATKIGAPVSGIGQDAAVSSATVPVSEQCFSVWPHCTLRPGRALENLWRAPIFDWFS